MRDCKTVLLVDDDPLVIKALGRVLEDTDIVLLTAESAAEALTLCQEQEVAVLISDHRMPGASGIALLKEIKTSYPATIRVLMTGDSSHNEIFEAVSDGLIDKLLTKPWNYEELLATVSLGLNQYQNS